MMTLWWRAENQNLNLPTVKTAFPTLFFLFALLGATSTLARDFTAIPTDPLPGDRMISAYFEGETKRLTDNSLRNITTAEDWKAKKGLYRQQLFEMVGLRPLPRRTPLKPVITGTVEHDGFTVQNIHFQSRPGLYVTGNLYLPKEMADRAPTILYVCGHAKVIIDEVSYGDKTDYHHHGAWFARNGYVCLTIDSLQRGEIQGHHHGTHRLDRWWWTARGYTPAGVEAWNGIRALDYLETRPEVDPKRIGVTGRSGGGAYSWWIAALDERIAAAVPVAGIASLKNHVVDGCVEGHCDCMFQVNTYRWDYANIAALVAPRPLLIANTDKDAIFPLDGVIDVYNKTRRIYRLLGAEQNIGLTITEGPHKDTQPLRVPAFHWFERHFKGKDLSDTFEVAATKHFEPAELKVFEELPTDEKNTVIDETFTRLAKKTAAPTSAEEWQEFRETRINALTQKSFRGWPKIEQPSEPVFVAYAEHDGVALETFDFLADGDRSGSPGLRLFLAKPAAIERSDLELAVLTVLDEPGWQDFLTSIGAAFPDLFTETELPELDTESFAQNCGMFASQKWAMAWIAPRGIGRTRWTSDPKEDNQIKRRFYLLGQTLDSMRVWDTRRALQSLRQLSGLAQTPLWLQGHETMAGIALYASLYEPDIARLELHNLPTSHREGPNFLNVLRYLDMPEAMALAAENSRIRLYNAKPSDWTFATKTATNLAWPKNQIQFRNVGEHEQTAHKATNTQD